MSEEQVSYGLITENWLKEVGFRWHQFDRQPDKHWLLWLGAAMDDRMTGTEDFGIELAICSHRVEDNAGWYCWLRDDCAGRYSRFIHVRHLRTQAEVIRLVEGLTGQDWNPANHLYGAAHTPKRAECLRAEDEGLDRQLLRDRPKWTEVEKDDTRGRALPEHMEAAEKIRTLPAVEPAPSKVTTGAKAHDCRKCGSPCTCLNPRRCKGCDLHDADDDGD